MKNKTIVKINAASLTGDAKVKITAKKPVYKSIIAIKYNGSETLNRELDGCGNVELDGAFKIKNPNLWSISSPCLYAYNAKIIYVDGESEILNGRFGFRTLGQNGKNLLVNGKPVFVRGYIRGAKAHDHANLSGLSLKDFYLKNLKEARKFGFNFVRFHSVVPEEELFEAADEVGMLVHVELRPPHDIYNNLEEMVTTGSAIVPEEFLEETVEKCFNHPSMAVYCIGNEIKKASADDIRKIKEKIDESDGTRLFLDTCAWGKNNRPYVDMDVQHLSYYFPFGKHAGMYDDTENLLAANTDENEPMKVSGKGCEVVRDLYFKVPLLAHEVCHYTALRDFYALKEKFIRSGAPMPWWVDEEIKLIEEKGYNKSIFGEMFRASKRFQFECWKTAYEEMRKSTLLGGFHFLQFADTDAYENSNGVVDCFDDETCVKPEDFLKFNGDRVLIADLGSRNYFCDEEIVFPVFFSNLGEDCVAKADLSITIDGDKKSCVSCEMKNLDVSRKGSYRLCKVRLRTPCKAGVYRLKIELATNGENYADNEWTLWIYERNAAKTYKEFTSYENGETVITADIRKAFSALNGGKRVCLIYRSEWTRHRRDSDMKNPEYAFKASWNRFKPVIWDRGTNFGGINDKQTLNKYGFPCEEYYDFNYSELSEDCDKVILDDFPVKVRKLISGIDKSSRDRFDAYKDAYNLPELMPDRTLRDFGYLFEVKVGSGSLLVCGLNLTGLDKGEPSATAMARFIENYIGSDDFKPESEITLEELKSYMAQCAKEPVRERTMTQFWELDDAPVESPEFWKTAKKYLTNV